MAKNIRFKNFDGYEYKIVLEKIPKSLGADGLCYPPENKKAAKITINPNQTPKNLRETILHEVTHSFFWELSEKQVSYFARQVSQILEKLG